MPMLKLCLEILSLNLTKIHQFTIFELSSSVGLVLSKIGKKLDLEIFGLLED